MTLHITVGIPGCGKTTWVNEQMAERGTVYGPIAVAPIYDVLNEARVVAVRISTDDIREKLAGDATRQDMNDDVFDLFHKKVDMCLRSGEEVFADATHLKPSARNAVRGIAHGLGVRAIAHRFAVSLDFETCQGRNMGRERTVPFHVMRRFYEDFCYKCRLDQLVSEGWEVDNIPANEYARIGAARLGF